jgi:hypothetical protein
VEDALRIHKRNKDATNNLFYCKFYTAAHVSHVTATLNISPVFLSDAARGLAQQMVFWGHDVRHPDGNSLVRFGMARSPSTGLTGTSCYSMLWENGRIELHGAVASWTPALPGNGCVFSRDRARIDLWHGDHPPVPGREYGCGGTVEERWAAFQPFLRWLISYESWIARTHGPDWRGGCWRALKRLPKGKPWLPPELAIRWWELAATSAPPRPKQLLK